MTTSGVLVCTVCCQNRSKDQGIQCPKGHFYCSVGNNSPCCVDGMVNAQIQSIRFQKANIVCPVCSLVVPWPSLELHLTTEKWKQLDSAAADAKMKPSPDGPGKKVNRVDASCVEACVEMIARQVKNETLNLMCPHCQTAYAQFDGCMAVSCSSCHKWFCGYCHDPFPNSSTSHQHVLMCNMNKNATHYANADELRRGQTMYRTNKLKEVLRPHQKDVQNATILALQRELADLGIDKATLLEG